MELGRGGSGPVYKGVLEDDRVVVVRKFGDVIQGGEEFWAEMSTIGRINHMNLVRMWGSVQKESTGSWSASMSRMGRWINTCSLKSAAMELACLTGRRGLELL